MPAPRFDWDGANADHIWLRHGVDIDEAEQAVTDRRRVRATAHHGERGERRSMIIGETESGRLLAVVCTDREGLTRVVTARDATSRERATYRRRGNKGG